MNTIQKFSIRPVEQVCSFSHNVETKWLNSEIDVLDIQSCFSLSRSCLLRSSRGGVWMYSSMCTWISSPSWSNWAKCRPKGCLSPFSVSCNGSVHVVCLLVDAGFGLHIVCCRSSKWGGKWGWNFRNILPLGLCKFSQFVSSLPYL